MRFAINPSLLIVLLIWNFGCCDSEQQDILDEVARFCVKNGHKYLTFVDFDQKEDIQAPYKTNSQSIISTSIVTFNQLQDMDMDTVIIFITKGEERRLGSVLKKVSKRKILKTILIIEESSITGLMSGLAMLKSNSFFYVLSYINEGNHKTANIWRRVMTLNHQTQVISNELSFDMNGKVIKEYNMAAIKLEATSLSWSPFLSVDNCNFEGKQCTVFGLLGDLMNIWGRAYNFTWDIYGDLDNDWGQNPVSGPYNISGVWKGVMGDVVAGRYPISLSSWRWLIIRDPLVDFVPIVKDKAVLAVIPKPPEVDPGLFIRPFRDDTWQGIGIMSAIGILFLFVPWIIIKDYFDMTANKIVLTSGWFFFVLINAYYGGALTMFFVSEITLPFNTIRDVLKAYPDWKMVHVKGSESMFQLPAQQGDQDYVDYMTRVEAQPEDYVVKTLQAGLDKMQSGPNILYTTNGRLKGFFSSNPFNQPSIKVFGGSRSRFDCLLLTKNSPLKPILRNGVSKTFERGEYERLQATWQGAEIKSAGAVDIMILTSGQVFLIFFELLISVGLSLICLIIECVTYRIKRQQLDEDIPTLIVERTETTRYSRLHLLEGGRLFIDRKRLGQ